MDKEQFLKNIERDFDKAVQCDKIENAISGYGLQASATDYLYGKSENPLQISIYSPETLPDYTHKEMARDLEDQWLETIEGDPVRHKEKALKLAEELERVAARLRAAL